MQYLLATKKNVKNKTETMFFTRRIGHQSTLAEGSDEDVVRFKFPHLDL